MDDTTEIVGFSGNEPHVAVVPPMAEIRMSPVDAPRCWYCAILEAFAWCFGTLSVHIAGGIAVAIVMAIVQIVFFHGKMPDFQDPRSMLILTAGEMILFVLASMLAVSVRYWGRTFSELNFSRPDFRHILLVIGGTLPMTFCVSLWSIPVQYCWHLIVEWQPALKIIDNLNSMTAVKEMAQVTPLYQMILVVAVLPAIGEELVFRGAIGRVSVANLGVWGGVIFTSILFGCIHLHPVHALAVIPLGIAIHLVYLSTRSFWMPMLLHFVNNVWATIVAQSESSKIAQEGLNLTLLDGVEMLSGIVASVALGFALWQSRTRLFHLDGQESNSSRFPVRIPLSPEVQRKSGPISATCWLLVIVSMVTCHAAVAIDLLTAGGQQ